MPNFSSPVSTQTDFFFTIFQLNFRIFQKNSEANLKIIRIWVCCFSYNYQSMFMQNFNSLSFFQENFRVFQKNSSANFKIIKIWVYSLMLQLAKHVHAKFQLSSSLIFYPDGLRQIFDHFSSKFQNFLILKKDPNRAS
jgi:hypothetical protein